MNTNRIIIKIKTDGSKDNIYVEIDRGVTLPDAYKLIGVTIDDEPIHVINTENIMIEEFFANGNSIKFIRQ